jgi:hypothetical protein
MSEQELRLGCLQLAIEVRSASTTTEQLLDQAEKFAGFVINPAGEAEAKVTKLRK